MLFLGPVDVVAGNQQIAGIIVGINAVNDVVFIDVIDDGDVFRLVAIEAVVDIPELGVHQPGVGRGALEPGVVVLGVLSN